MLTDNIFQTFFFFIPGQKFALLEEKVMLSSIFRNFHVKSCQTSEELFPIAELILRPGDGIEVILTNRRKETDVWKVHRSLYPQMSMLLIGTHLRDNCFIFYIQIYFYFCFHDIHLHYVLLCMKNHYNNVFVV